MKATGVLLTDNNYKSKFHKVLKISHHVFNSEITEIEHISQVLSELFFQNRPGQVTKGFQ